MPPAWARSTGFLVGLAVAGQGEGGRQGRAFAKRMASESACAGLLLCRTAAGAQLGF